MKTRILPLGVEIVLGVSGGPDSVALLHLFAELRHDTELAPRPIVAHLNHQLRGAESDEDAEFVRSLCASLEVPCHIEAREVGSKNPKKRSGKGTTTPLDPPLVRGEAGSPAEPYEPHSTAMPPKDNPPCENRAKAGIEEAARRTRYDFFYRVCLLTGSKYVAVAHHADDQVETVLHRIIRGTGIRGLAGMPVKRPLRHGSDITLIRPLLPFSREYILSYLRRNSFPFRQDSSNDLHGPTRNRIRHKLIPLLAGEFNVRASDAVLRLSAQARLVYDHLSDAAARGFEPLLVSRDPGVIVLDAEGLRHKSPILQAEIIRIACVELGLGERDLSFEHMNSVAALLDETSEEWRINLPGNTFVERRGNQLIFSLSPH
ncbi:MAG: tRNA lysidine(34) synthetase TilS [Planctomycetes bacterium]|nr:tRNA lysidine(34) synthetase TilS [Planctomycetota bacterium]MBI3834482.1 tRNA lysidine(34) synthetase TilS [Planctomycetota bacterium]